MKFSAREQFELLTRGAADVVPREEFLAKLGENRPLRIKLGVDPTAPDIHLGHTVGLSRMRLFQDLGHQAILLIGDFTAMIGDPSGRSSTRPQLTREAVTAAARSYQEQVLKILDPDRLEIRYNGEWLGKLGFDDVVRLCAQATVARMLERDDFSKRYADGAPIGLHEFLYPLMQAHDSVALKADVELGGTDQTFNILLGRQLQKDAGQNPQVALILPLLEGTDGVQKMSKSLGNYIGVAEPPSEIFGKVMSISDELMFRYYHLLTTEDVASLRANIAAGKYHPMDAKKNLAQLLTARFHGDDAGAQARAGFEERFQQRHLDEGTLGEFVHTAEGAKIRIPNLLRDAGLVKSNSDARRLLAQNAVRIDGSTITAEEIERPANPIVVEVGKRRAIRVRFES